MVTRAAAFYQYHASLMEPWDGPASMTFTDGTASPRPIAPSSNIFGSFQRVRHDRDANMIRDSLFTARERLF